MGPLVAMRAGLVDSFSPAVLTCVLIVLVSAHFLLRRSRGMARISVAFFLGMVVSLSSQNLGMFDQILGSRVFDAVLEGVYFSLSLAALLVGTILFLDWRSERRGGTVRIVFPYLAAERPGLPPGKVSWWAWPWETVKVGVPAYFLGFVVSFLFAAFPADASIAMLFYDLSLPGNVVKAVAMFFVYGSLALLPVAGVLTAICLLSKRPDLQAEASRFIWVIRVVLSAVFLAYGLGMLGVYYLRPGL